MTGRSANARRRDPGFCIIGVFLLLAGCIIPGCSIPAQHMEEEQKKPFPLPTVRVPLLKFPLTGRGNHGGVLAHFKQEPSASPSPKW